MSTPRVLFVAHEATRTGAPIMLLHFLRWIREHTDLEFEVLLLSGGAMVAEFSAVATTHLLSARGMAPVTYVEAGMVRAGLSRSADTMKLGRLRRASRNLTGYDALYLNSTTSALALRFLPEIPPVVFSHVHELDSAFAYWFPKEQRNAMLSKTDWFVTCADAVSRNLVAAHGVERSRIRRHYEFINPPIAEHEGSLATRRDLGIPDTAFVVGSVGQVIWRKAPDLFLQAAADLRRRRPDIDAHFVWIGGVDPRDLTPVATDLVRLGLADRMHFVGEVAAPADLLATFDVFCLTSREDPFPLVMLEAAALGVPGGLLRERRRRRVRGTRRRRSAPCRHRPLPRRRSHGRGDRRAGRRRPRAEAARRAGPRPSPGRAHGRGRGPCALRGPRRRDRDDHAGGNPLVNLGPVSVGRTSSADVLLISHSGARAGAPMVLFHFLRWMRANTSVTDEVVLLHGGSMEDDFKDLGARVVGGTQSRLWMLQHGLSRLGHAKASGVLALARLRPVLQPHRNTPVVLLNSVGALAALRFFPEGSRHVVLYVHEMGDSFEGTVGADVWRRFSPSVDRFITSAACVTEELVERRGIAPERIVEHHGFIERPRVEPLRSAYLRERLGIGPRRADHRGRWSPRVAQGS